MELVPHTNYEFLKPEVINEFDARKTEVLALTALAAVATVVLVPIALGRGHGSRILNRINDSPAIERIKNVVLPMFNAEEPALRRSQILRNKNRFVANPDAVSVIEDDFNPASYSNIPKVHTSQEELLG
jgi:hypothetical protein